MERMEMGNYYSWFGMEGIRGLLCMELLVNWYGWWRNVNMEWRWWIVIWNEGDKILRLRY